ncbi:hypothetical protein [Flavobacterium sp. FlaQc-30]|uniref:hypothetical protein n=1 Tax=Flavobacterium sp. FlaQc-30 TaxID=3374179 RepID=UPI0037563406
MKKIFLFLSALVYFSIIIIMRKYPENHVLSFLSGVFAATGVTFFVYVITKKSISRSK